MTHYPLPSEDTGRNKELAIAKGNGKASEGRVWRWSSKSWRSPELSQLQLIYFKDRDDLILQCGWQEVQKLSSYVAGFDPDMRFDEGWKFNGWIARGVYGKPTACILWNK